MAVLFTLSQRELFDAPFPEVANSPWNLTPPGAIEGDRQVIVSHVSAPKFVLTITLERTATAGWGLSWK